MLQALGLETIVNSAYNAEINSLLIEEDSDPLANLTPNFEKLSKNKLSAFQCSERGGSMQL